MSGCVKGKGRGVARDAQVGRAHPYESSRNLVIRGHPRLSPLVAMIPLWELWLPSFRKIGLTSMLRQGSGYRLVSGRQRPNCLGKTANDGHEAGNAL